MVNPDKDILQEEYNLTPYQSFPFSQTHPTHLYTLAKLFSLHPKEIDKARVLELGCASGGNLIPMAYHFPHTEFLGIDLAEKQVEVGLQQISDLDLKNITIRAQSILDFNNNDGKFDYIICHGVYSWVNDEIRDKILQICHENLTKNGIAYVSYNTFPGWNAVNSIRELMTWHTKNISDPQSKAQQARVILKFMSDGLQNDKAPYAEFLRQEITLLSKQSDSYLLHDHLSSYNAPVYFHQFMEQANKHKLSYLSDAFLPTMFTENLPQPFATELKKINNIIVISQYMDFIRNQRFRSTLLCHQNEQVNRSLKTNDIENFYLKLLGTPTIPHLSEKDLKDGKEITFTYGSLSLTVRSHISQCAMLILHEERHTYLHYHDLCKKVMQRTSIQDLKIAKLQLNDDLNLMRAVFAGIINISSYPAFYTIEIAKKPYACPLARYQVTRQPFVTNRRHEPVALDAISKIILAHLDGKNTLNTLVDILKKQVKNGTLTMLDDQKQPIQDLAKIESNIPLLCKTALKNIADHALLIAHS